MSDDNTPQEDVSELRKAAEGAKSARAEAEAARRELAFVKAGINTDSKPAQALLRSYDGELTTEAIRAEAKEWSLYSETEAQPAPAAEVPAEPQSVITDDERALQAMRDDNAGSPAPVEQRQIDAYGKVFKQFEQDREDGVSQVEATNRAIGGLIKEAAMGNPTAIFDEDAWMEKASQHGHGAQFSRG